ncbi:DUF72 domain-containing protein [Gordonia sp. NPDC003429]
MLHIGTSGWQYKDWRGRFYPTTVPQRQWLAWYAQTFSTVEVNNTFYRLPQRSTFLRWADEVPDGFVMTVKMSRYLTHVRRLADPAEPVQRFVDRATALGTRLGPVLLQLPPTLDARPDALAETLDAFGGAMRLVVEPRHPSWWNDDVRAVLTAHNAALCWADRDGRSMTPLWRTADFGYLRMHSGRASPPTAYGVRAIDTWAGRLGETFGTDDVYVYFNNDTGGAAVDNALTMIRRSTR